MRVVDRAAVQQVAHMRMVDKVAVQQVAQMQMQCIFKRHFRM